MKCYKCDSVSTIEDSDRWVCWEHISPCKCGKGHDIKENEWDFEKRENGISYTIKAMVNEMPDKHYTDSQNGDGRN